MPDNFYDSGSEDDSESSPSTAESDESTKPKSEDDEDQGETLIPKSILGNRDCKPGEKLTFEVTHVYEDEVSCKFVGYGKDSKDKSNKEDSSDGESEDMKDSMSQLEDSYA